MFLGPKFVAIADSELPEIVFRLQPTVAKTMKNRQPTNRLAIVDVDVICDRPISLIRIDNFITTSSDLLTIGTNILAHLMGRFCLRA